MRISSALPALFATLAGALPAMAQDDLSVDEVVNAWNRQKQVFHEAQSNGLGKTRGLTLITVEGAQAATVAAQESAAAATATPTAEAAPETAPTDPNKPLVAATDATPPATPETAPAATTVVFGQLDPELQVNLQIKFGFDSAALSDDQKPRLNKICEAMKLSDVSLFRIVGHTDSAGSDAYNERLSQLRAEEVARYLTDDCGITATRLETMGLGERFPFDPKNPTADENRRVEFQALS